MREVGACSGNRTTHSSTAVMNYPPTMDIEAINAERERLNNVMAEHDTFFEQFGQLDEAVYASEAIPKRYKELTGVSISVLTRCDDCVVYHIQGALAAGADSSQLIEAIKLGVVGGGSITYPTARYAFAVLEALDQLDTPANS